MKDMRTLVNELEKAKEEARLMGGEEAVAKLHKRGKLTARERVDALLDPGTFRELGVLARSVVETPGKGSQIVAADGVVAGWGEIDGRKVYVAADDATALGGARGQPGNAKVSQVKQLALEQGRPIISLFEASAGRAQDLMSSRFAKGSNSFTQQAQVSGSVPSVAALMGGCFGQPSFMAMMSDFRPMVRGTSFMGISGPPVVLGGIGERVTPEELGGSDFQCNQNGLADYEAADDLDCLRIIREYLSYFPSSCFELPPRRLSGDNPNRRCEELLDIVPTNPRRSYDMHDLIRSIVDDGNFLSIKPGFARNIITALARIDGYPVGIVANQPMHIAGIIDHLASYKASRFVDICDAFHIPIIFMQDLPGFLVGSSVEKESGLIMAMRLVMTIAEATVPKLTVIVRKAYGLAYVALGGKGVNPDLLVAWPTASIAMMGPEAGSNVIYQRQLAEAEDPDALREQYAEQFRGASAPETAAENFFVDDIIDPADTRAVLAAAVEMAQGKCLRQLGRKHSNRP